MIAVLIGGPAASPDTETVVYDLALRAVVQRASRARLAVPTASADLSKMWAHAAAPGSSTADLRTRSLAYAAPDTVEAFIHESSRSQRVPKALGRLKAYRLVDAGRLAEAERTSAWERFARDENVDSAGVARVSAIGFNAARTEALVFVGDGSTTWFVLLRLGVAGWVVGYTDLIAEA
jgi:hypothetical protein